MRNFTYLMSLLLILSTISLSGQQLEDIGRGVVAVKQQAGIYVGWRLLGTEDDDLGFNLYRIADTEAAEKLNDTPLTGATNYFDSTAVLTADNQYFVVPVSNNTEGDASDTVGVWGQNFLNIPLNRPEGGSTADGSYTYSPNDASVADLDGDGEYEIVLKWDPSNAKDNSQAGHTGNVILDAYEMDGTHMWRLDLGVNIRAGAHYNQFMVYDLDQDGKAEVALRTAPGAKDATGVYISEGPAGDADHTVDYRNGSGYILTGPEYLTIFNGQDGTEITSVNLEPDRGNVNDWGDGYGNRVDRFLAAVAYLDGAKPALVWCRGIYTKVEIAAYDFSEGQLSQKWIFKSQEGYPDWSGMGSHNLSVGDVDLDGKDEIVYGHCAIDDDGTGLWSLKPALGTMSGDAMHLADMIPERQGLERWACGEGSGPGSHLVDAATGEVLFATAPADVGRATAGAMVAGFYGMEMWGGTTGLVTGNNSRVGNFPNSTNHVVWWDGDLGRELLNGTAISKYPSGTLLNASGCSANNGSKSNPSLQADLFGDWREEVIWRTSDNQNLRIYTTTDVTEHRIKTLMHDRQYRLAIAWQNNSYNQPPHTSFYLGFDMFTPAEQIPPSQPAGVDINVATAFIELKWSPNKESDLAGYKIFRSESGGDFDPLNDTLITTASFRDSTIVLDIEYSYYVTALDTLGNESSPSSIVTGLPTYKPDPPTGITGRGGYNKGLVFWVLAPDSLNITGYNVYIAQTAGGTFTKVNEAAITENSYTFDDLQNGRSYYCVVTSVDGDGLESFYPSEVVISPSERIVIQAEDAIYENVSMDSNHIGFNGTGFANFDGTGFVELQYVYSRFSSWYEVITRHALGNSARTGTVTVNDTTFNFTMDDTGDWANYVYDTMIVELKTGFNNTIRFDATGSDFGNLDEIIIGDRTSAPEPEPEPEPELTTNDLANSLKVYPNPFESSMKIEFQLDGNTDPTLSLTNLLGQEIFLQTLESETNLYELEWNGTNTHGQELPQGIYFGRIKLGGQTVHSFRIMKIK